MEKNLHHIISTKQFLKREIVEKIFALADTFESLNKKGDIPQIFKGKILASLFYEPSTRTRFSFEVAALKLGGEVISTENAEHFSSAIKGESLEDTIRIVGGYADVIVLRHSEAGSAQKAAAISAVPVINAGDGSGEHPTQALLDLYTIKKEFGSIDNFRIALVGDLRYGRTIHSLIHLLSLCKNREVFLVAPKQLPLPPEYISFLRTRKIKFSQSTDLNPILSHADIFYITRIQKERFASPSLYEKVKDSFIIDRKATKKMKKRAIIMHPLPRVYEIKQEVDADKRAVYFRQAQNGLYIRMALLNLIFKNEEA